ncbi:unnamed protein product [Caenorhabditis bovis]|uniref:Protein kinase domain-containing protein n=1 Tax=Caenorhabditis bovis TaxID=2654633 RepID=A0A8S1EX51_9PELO|nr:unnamed protein product [Caenorhabditis bovis]
MRTAQSNTPGKLGRVKSGTSLSGVRYRYKPGEEVEGVNTYKVLHVLRKSNKYGRVDVYTVKEPEQEDECRLKIGNLELGKLKLEASILKHSLKFPGERCFPDLYEYGTIPKHKLEFVVISQLGTNLEEIMRKVVKGLFSLECVMNIAISTLKGIQDLHKLGYVHRNIRPAAFYVGMKDRDSNIYIQDFRAARKIFDKERRHLPARSKVKWHGTKRYASRASLNEKDQGRRDDLESWIYMIFAILDSESITWKKESDLKRNAADKDVFMRNSIPTQYAKMPEDMKQAVSYVNDLLYDTEPEYTKLVGIIMDIRQKLQKAETAQRSQRKKKPTRKKLITGDVIRSEGKPGWKVINLLGSGGFGDVYKVYREGGSPDKCYALKTESEDGDRRLLRLKVEVNVMMKTAEKIKSFEHFIEFVDRGKCEALKCKFVVMGLVGPSIDDIRKKYLLSSFSKNTCFNIAIQTVQAVADLHSIGYLHRDIKPANYAVGLNEFESVIYMLDFGIAKSFLDADGNHKAPRKKVKFLGTMRFASRACMRQIDQGRKDDLECWIYMFFDLMDEHFGIPWRRLMEPKAILKMKEKFFIGEFPEVFKRVPKSMSNILQYVNGLEYESTPDYEYILTFLKTCAKDNGIKPDKKLDWIGKLKKKAFDTDSEKSDKNQKQSGEDE